MSDVILPRRVVPQPVPSLVAGGDCGACVLGGLLGLAVPEVYGRLNDGKVEAFTWQEIRGALHRAEREGLLDRIVDDVPQWPHARPASIASFGSPSWLQNMQWWAYVRMAFDAGHYALTGVNLEKGGPFSNIDHFVMLVGVRETEREKAYGGEQPVRWLEREVLVSCSSTRTPAEEWVTVGDFLKERGGFNVLLARPIP